MDEAWIALRLTLKVAGFATLINLVLGIGIAYWFARRDIWAKDWLDALLTLPMVMPPTVLGYYLLVLLGRQGFVGQWLQSWGINLIFSWQGAVIAASIVSFPLVFKAARAAFEGVENAPPWLVDLARERGAGLVDLLALPPRADNRPGRTENGIHLSAAGYAEAAAAFVAATGRELPAGFADRSLELRREVAAKNTLFFHRWRPANETYIFLFRKHEQGNNAVEMPQFDPLVDEAERKVRLLAKGARSE